MQIDWNHDNEKICVRNTCKTKKNQCIYVCMAFDSIMPKAYQNDTTAKQAIVGKNKQNFILKVNGTYTKIGTCYDSNY